MSISKNPQEMSPTVIEINNNQPRRWTPAKVKLLLGAAAVCAGLYTADKIGNIFDSLGDLGGLAPRQEATISSENVLTNISFPNQLPLIEGDGENKTSEKIELRSKVPIVGSLWNLIAPLAEMNASATTQNRVQIGIKGSSIKLSPYTLNMKASNNTGIEATVNTDGLYSQIVSNEIEDQKYSLNSKNFSTQVNTSDGFILKLSPFINTHQAQRALNVEEISKESFQNVCGQAIVQDLTPAVSNTVRNEVSQVNNLIVNSPNGQTTAKSVSKMLNNPIKVLFTKTIASRNGHIGQINIFPENITLPKQSTSTKNELAHELNVSANDITINNSQSCYFNNHAATQQEVLLSQSANSSATRIVRGK